MFAYLLLLAAVLTRVLPHAGWMNFTAVGGALLFFGARRSWREMLLPLVALGQILLSAKTTFVRAAAATLLGPTSFFLISNYAVWAGGGLYPHTLAGLQACYVAAIPFYRNDLASTAIVLGAAIGVPALLRRLHPAPAQTALAGK